MTGSKAALQGAIVALQLPEPESLASWVLAEMVGAMALARATGDDDQASSILRASREQLIRRLNI